MAAVALVKRKQRTGRKITQADLDRLRNVCRCGTYPRIREAIRDGERAMRKQKRKAKKVPKAKSATT
jgi:isoquinoline 1-oxidoreductase alpha subunit